nr:hypothetical protein [Tanacetum cinerariifolium]
MCAVHGAIKFVESVRGKGFMNKKRSSLKTLLFGVQVRVQDGTGTTSFILMEPEADDDNSFSDNFKDMLGKRVISKLKSQTSTLLIAPVVEAGVDADLVNDS